MRKFASAWIVALLIAGLGVTSSEAAADPQDRAKWVVDLGFLKNGLLEVNFTTTDTVQVSYSAAGFPKGSRVLLQRHTGKTWQTVKKLAQGRDITATVGRLPMGRAVYRLVVLNRAGRYIADTSLTLFVYGRVSLDALREENFHDAPGTSDEAVIDGNPYPVVFYAHSGDIVVQVRRTTCNSFTLGAGLEYPGQDGASDTGFVVQARIDGTSVAENTFPALTWNVVTQRVTPGKTFAWNIYKNDESQPNPVYGNGFAMCLTRTGHA